MPAGIQEPLVNHIKTFVGSVILPLCPIKRLGPFWEKDRQLCGLVDFPGKAGQILSRRVEFSVPKESAIGALIIFRALGYQLAGELNKLQDVGGKSQGRDRIHVPPT